MDNSKAQTYAQDSAQDSAQDLSALGDLSAPELAALAQQMLARISQQSQHLAEQDKVIAARDQLIARRERELKFKTTALERITFELARLKAGKFAARTEAMNAKQRQLFEETLAADEASPQAQLEAVQDLPPVPAPADEPRRQPKRQALPEHLVRVEHHHEPESTLCPTA